MSQQEMFKGKEAETQKSKIWSHLRKGRSITAMEAISKYSVMRLSEYIRQLRHEDGHNISTTFHKGTSGSRFAVYKLEE